MSPPCEAASDAAKQQDPRVGLILALAFVTVEAATPIEEWPRFIGYGALLLVAIVWSRVPFGWLVKRLGLALPFVIGIGASVLFVRPQEGDVVDLPWVGLVASRAMLLLLASVTVKAALSIGALSLLVALWDFPKVLHAMQALRLPKLFVMLMAFMWRYLYLLGDEARRTMQARDARGSQGSLPRRAAVVGAMTGSLFLRGYERAERIGHAMVARGYHGELRTLTALRRFTWVDALAVLGAAVGLAVIRLA